ncbi:hypothetical protein D9756_003731 [Leucocoprinus leucothites]|uniref:Uncharacterized protein n=1 Tax=Leucocoprinus leucothites TaxID=201217 RepID=A0A8H5G0V6_9AGAR|nr:hypothetical protein D9756_003731 [Leucoagaricus leucothites]
MSKPLDYLRLSPVRGQLEPYDPKSPSGWRYVQTTDTLNELKVLIPPGTAAMYEQLLKLEKYELTKKSINWPRVIEIRRLKDRMVRKCQKLARAAIPPSESLSPFQTYIASEDFRVKEMERWFREQQKRANATAVRHALMEPVPSSTEHTRHDITHPQCPQCIAGAGVSSSNILTAPPKKQTATTSQPPHKSNLQRSATSANTGSRASFKPGLYSRAQALISVSRAIKPGRSTSLPTSQNSQNQLTRSATRPSVISPPPLPILLRGQRSQFGLEDDLGQAESALGDSEFPESSVSDSPPPPAPKEVPIGQDQLPQSSPQSSGDETSSPNPTGSVTRRRSCIKRGSVSELGAKTVSWADDQELGNHLSRFASAAEDAQTSGRRWEEIREIYLEQISGLENLQLQVREGLENLKTESEHLQRVDDTIRRQREQLRSTFDEFERKQCLFNEKVKDALEQADDVMSRHGLRKNTLSITNE